MRGFTISLSADHYLTVDEIWPDGDAPESPTAADVKAVMEKCGSKGTVLRDWCIDDVDVTVYGPPTGNGVDKAEVWDQ